MVAPALFLPIGDCSSQLAGTARNLWISGRPVSSRICGVRGDFSTHSEPCLTWSQYLLKFRQSGGRRLRLRLLLGKQGRSPSRPRPVENRSVPKSIATPDCDVRPENAEFV